MACLVCLSGFRVVSVPLGDRSWSWSALSVLNPPTALVGHNLRDSPPCETHKSPSTLRVDVIDRGPFQRNAMQADLHSIRFRQEVVANL